jgi:hypothetical protein
LIKIAATYHAGRTPRGVICPFPANVDSVGLLMSTRRDGSGALGCAWFMIVGRSVCCAFIVVVVAAESGCHVDAAEAVAGGAGRYRQGGQEGVP